MTASGSRPLLFSFCFLWTAPALFGGGVVTNCTEADLRAALVGGGTATFACAGSITLSETLMVNEPTVIDAAGWAVTIRGAGKRVILVSNGSLELRGITISDGGALVDGLYGGGVRAINSTVVLEHCTFTNNMANSGAAIYLERSVLGATGCTFVENKAGNAAAVSVGIRSKAAITNSTFYHNSSHTLGERMARASVADSQSPDLVFVNCTITRNTSGPRSDGPPRPAIVVLYPLSLYNCILSDNLGGNLESLGLEGIGNLSDDLSGTFPDPNNLVNVDPLLVGPISYDGKTFGFQLQPGSPALDAGSMEFCPTQDQRGLPRPRGTGCDIGAWEMQPPMGPPLVGTGAADLGLIAGRTAGLEASVDSAGYETWVYFEYGTSSSLANMSGAVAVESNALSVPVSASIGGLQPGFEYFYRAVATNSAGRDEGKIKSFYVAAPLLDCTEAVLRQALAFTNKVSFQCGGIIPLEETLVIDGDVTLDGSGAGTTLSGQGARRLFVVEPGVTLTLRGLSLVDGYGLGAAGGSATPTPPGQPGLGGCILNLGGTVILEGCVLSGHLAEGGPGGTSGQNQARGGEGYGGAIYNQGGQVIIDHCVFMNNAAVGGFGSADPQALSKNGDSGNAAGGAIYCQGGLLTVDSATFVANTATGGEPQYGALDMYSRGGDAGGGAIGATDCTFLLRSSVLASNSVITPRIPWGGRGTGFAQGGALFLDFNVKATVLETSFLANRSESGRVTRYAPVGKASGGAIFNRGNLHLSDSTLMGNQSVAGMGNDGAEGNGGAVSSSGALTITGSTFNQNSATGSAGLGISGSSRHGFDGAGGAVWSGGVLNVTNSTFTANLAQGGNADEQFSTATTGGSGLGGALHVGSGTAVLVNLTIANNQALGGGADRNGKLPLGPSLGAGVSGRGSIEVLNTILANNSPGSNVFGSVTDGGYNISSDDTPSLTGPGSLNDTDPRLDQLIDNGGRTLTMALLAGSPALDAGSTESCPKEDQRRFLRPNGMGCDIGALEMQPTPTGLLDCTEAGLRRALALTNLLVFQCRGVIPLSETLVIDRDLTLDATGTETTLSGQGLRRLFVVEPGVTLTLRGLSLVDGYALGEAGGSGTPTPPGQPGLGGCILNLGGTVILDRCVLSGHVAEGGPGGTSGENKARGGEGYGGAIYNQGGQVIVDACNFNNNAVLGGIGSTDPRCEFNNGDAGNAVGGAIYSENGAVEVRASTLVANTASGGPPQYGCLENYSRGGDAAGGAIGATNSSVFLQGSVLATNSTSSLRSPWTGRGNGHTKGGALMLDSGAEVTVVETTFLGNLSQSFGGSRYAPVGNASGGAIFNRGNLRLADSILTGNRSVAGSGNNGAQGDGGAVSSTGILIITGSTFDQNSATGSAGIGVSGFSRNGFDGSGGAVWSSGLVNVTNSTFTANLAQGGNGDEQFGSPTTGGAGSGGALHVESGTAVLVNLTIANNQALGGGADRNGKLPLGPSQGAGVSGRGSIEVLNTILANNSPGSNVFGSVTDGGYNISSDDTPALTGAGSLNGTDPGLGPLADNGGPTPTMALLAGSPAVDAIPAGAPLVDQRGVSRPHGLKADSGAFEADMLTVHIALDGGNVIITCDAEAGQTYELFRWTASGRWEHMGSQTAETSQPVRFTQPIHADDSVLYRIASE